MNREEGAVNMGNEGSPSLPNRVGETLTGAAPSAGEPGRAGKLFITIPKNTPEVNVNGENMAAVPMPMAVSAPPPPPAEERAGPANTPEGIVSGAEVGAGAAQQEEEDEEEEGGVILGDHFKVETRRYGETIGKVYYVDDNLISIMPDGVSNILHYFPLVDSEEGRVFDPELGFISITQVGNGPNVGFAELNGFQEGQMIDTFLEDGSLGQSYKITEVNYERDYIRVEDERDPIEFDFKGIQGQPFKVIRIQQATAGPQKPMTAEEIAEEDHAIRLSQTSGAAAAAVMGDQPDDDDIVFFDDFELPKIAILKEIAAADVVYPELTQIKDLFNDLISMIDAPSQKDPLVIKRITALVKMTSSLKNSIIKRGSNGIPIGEETISIETVNDLLKEPTPIARPILDTRRVLYEDKGDEDNDGRRLHNQLLVNSLEGVIQSSKEYYENQGDIPPGQPGVGLPRFHQMLQTYFSRFPLGDVYSGGSFVFPHDAEFFRQAEPETSNVFGLLTGLGKEKKKQYSGKYINNHIGSIDFSLRRGHGPTYRSLTKGGTEISMGGDRANIKGNVLFPYKAVLSGQIGATRTGNLWSMVQRSSAPKEWMKKILEDLGGISAELSADKIIVMHEDEADAIGIPFLDYFKLILQMLVPRGPGDLSPIKADLGMEEKEPNVEQHDAIQQRVNQILASIREHIRSMRDGLAKEQPKPVANQLISQGFVDALLDSVKGYPELETIVKQMQDRTPGYKYVDIGLVGSLLKYAYDYFQVFIGGDQQAIKRERNRFVRDTMVAALRDAQQLADLQRNVGAPPQPNPCEHVATLSAIRSAENDNDRLKLMSRFITTYYGVREKNWVMCKLCKKELICQHEVLQIQQFINPREKKALQKEIIMNFSGGISGAHYSCRNCSFPIADLEYDTNVEFDDNGLPMMGREVLVDKDAIANEEIRSLFGIQINATEEIQFETDTKTEIYTVLKTLCDTLGLTLEGDAIGMIVDRIAAEIAVTISSKDYQALPKEQRKFTYIKFLSQVKIAATAAMLLIHIQTHIPGYRVKFFVEGCKPGFGGFPLISSADPSSDSQSPGVNYITCVLSGMYVKTTPWINGFQTIANDTQRTAFIKSRIVSYCKVFLQDSAIQELLQAKRTHMDTMLGKGASTARALELIPDNFLPRMEVEEESSANATQSPTIREGTKQTSVGEALKSDTWIRAANQIARRSANVIKGSPYVETSCCCDPIDRPGQSFRDAALPPLPELYVVKPGWAYQSIAYTPMTVRPLQITVASLSIESAYRVFLKLCHDGPRKGLPHELGYDLKCDWCGIEIPTQYLYPEIDYIPKKPKEEAELAIKLAQREEEIKSFLQTQGIVINEETFQELLDAAHQRQMFALYTPNLPQAPSEILSGLTTVSFEPVPGFATVLEQSEAALEALGAQASGPDIARALSGLRDSIRDSETLIQQKLGEGRFKLLTSMLDEPTGQVFEIIRSYFLVPIQRVRSGPGYEPVHVPAHYKLEGEHKEIVNKMIDTHLDLIKKFNLYPDENPDSLMKAQFKFEQFQIQMSELMALSPELRVSRIKFSKKLSQEQVARFLKEIIRVWLIGSLGQLIDPDVVPEVEGVDLAAEDGNSDSFIVRLLAAVIAQYSVERLAYNPTVVKQKIEEATEAEHQRFLNKMRGMSEEDKRIEMEKKTLGMGMWGRGKTKLGNLFSGEELELRRQEMMENYGALLVGGPDGFGGDEYGGGGAEEEGYDVGFIDEDND